MKLPLLTVLAVISLMFTMVSSAGIYKCVSTDGSIEFRQKPCDKSKTKEEVVSTVTNQNGTASKKTATYAQTIRVYPGAKLRNKDIEPGYGEFHEYKSNADFKKVVDYYTKQAGEENCEFLQKDNYNCSYKKVIGYGSGDVYIAEYKDHVLISMMKHPN